LEKVCLLNPPGKRSYLRDYYCSKISKARYILHPVDLVMLSGTLDTQYTVEVIDAIAEKIPPAKCHKKILRIDPVAVVVMTGAVSYQEDFSFLEQLKESSPDIKLIGTGDILMERGNETLKENSFLDAIILDFTTPDIIKYLQGDSPDNMIYRKGREIINGEIKRGRGEEFVIPRPRHELFPNHLYSSPFAHRFPVVTVLTDYGCPYHCSFCIMPSLGFKYRSLENVLEELEYIYSMEVRELYIDDQTFGLNSDRTVLLCKEMIKRRFNFGWSCLSRADVLNEDLLRIMKKAGCHTIIFGVESGSPATLKRYGKKMEVSTIENIFKLCRRFHIMTAGTFIIGLPGEGVGEVLSTIELAKKLNCDYASFNVAVPRMGTGLRKLAIKGNLISPGLMPQDQSGNYIAMATDRLTDSQIFSLKRRAIREFYLRPGYLWQRLRHLKNYSHLLSQFKEGIRLLGNLWR